jgi:riboflavin biosynthesis pyrimidine reductase
MSFPKMDFPRDQITSTNCFRDEALIASVHQKGISTEFLPKVAETYGKIVFPHGNKYPYIFASIALSMDGKMAYPDNLDGDMLVHSNTLNSDGALADFYVLNFLRAYSDAVVIGTRSMKAEANEWITIYDEDLICERVTHLAGKAEQPFTIVSSKDGTDIPFEHLLFHQDLIPVLVFTSPSGFEYIEQHASGNFYFLDKVSKEAIYKKAGKTPVVVTGQDSETDITLFFEKIKSAGFDHILIESPMLMWLLMKEKLLNEFFITYSSIFVGGQYSPGYFSPFTFDNHPQSQVASLNHHNNTFFYTRQILEPEK